MILPAGLRLLDPDPSAVPPAQIQPACGVEIPLALMDAECFAAELRASTCQALLAAGHRIQMNATPPHPTPNTVCYGDRSHCLSHHAARDDKLLACTICDLS